MTTYVINSRFGVHKSGTKFYQAFSIYEAGESSTTGVTIGHYGKTEPMLARWDKKGFLRPVLGGQVDVWPATQVSFYEKCESKFSKGGYSVDEHTWTEQTSDLLTFLKNRFGAKSQHKIEQALEGREVAVDDTVTGPGTAAHNDTTEATPEAKPETWGSW